MLFRSPQQGALDFVSLGALIHRLDPGIIPFRKASECKIHVSGGEFNCAANLSDCFGLKTGVVSAMVDYPIGALIAERVRAMRESLPKEIELAVDMHGRYDLGTGKRVAKELEPFRLTWLEEPVPAENIDAMAGREVKIVHSIERCIDGRLGRTCDSRQTQ